MIKSALGLNYLIYIILSGFLQYRTYMQILGDAVELALPGTYKYVSRFIVLIVLVPDEGARRRNVERLKDSRAPLVLSTV